MGELVCESESHFLDQCDLNAKQRASLLDGLKLNIISFGIQPQHFHNNIGSIISFDWQGTENGHTDESAEHEAKGDCFNRRAKFLDSLSKFKKYGLIKILSI